MVRLFLIALAQVALSDLGERLPQSMPREPRGEIVLGMSTALSGPAADLGQQVLDGVQLAIDEINDAGGVHGRRIRLVALDDGYEPARTGPNVRRLVEEDKVLAIVGNVGTPTAIATIPIITASKTPFVGALSGAGVLRVTPPNRYVVNYRASYAEEAAAMVDALIGEGGLKPAEIGFFTQRDTYGDAGFAGGIAALKRHGLKDERLIAHGRYERNTLAVENGLADLLRASPAPRAVILVGAYAPCAAFIRLARDVGLDAVFLNVSFVGSCSLVEGLGPEISDVIVTQVVPHYTADVPLVRQFRAAQGRRGPAVACGFVRLEGYIVMRMLERALRASPASLTREGLVDALERLDEFDLGIGEPLHLSATAHQACHRIWPTVIRNGATFPFEWSELRGILSKGIH